MRDPLRQIRLHFLAGRGIALALLLVPLGCGSSRPRVPVSEPVSLADPRIARGQVEFMGYCNPCHPGGTAGVGPGLIDKPIPGWFIKYQVRHGLGAMPHFSKEHLSDSDLDAIVAYLKAMRKR
ncbi:MAG: c-type cytochrome [Bacillota bacterium]